MPILNPFFQQCYSSGILFHFAFNENVAEFSVAEAVATGYIVIVIQRAEDNYAVLCLDGKTRISLIEQRSESHKSPQKPFSKNSRKPT